MNRDESFIRDLETELEPFNLDRRDFLKVLGGGIFVLFSLTADELTAQRGRRRKVAYPDDPNAYLRIGEDGRVTLFTGKIEMGQGVVTSLAMMLADELDVPPNTVDTVMGDTAHCPYDMGTFGSMSTKYFGPYLRQAGASARAVLMRLGSEFLKTPVDQLAVKDGAVFVKHSPARKVSYAVLARGKKLVEIVRDKPAVKHYSQHTVCGKPAGRADALGKVTGRAKYSGDIRLPGMLYARLVRPPVHGAKLKRADTSAAGKMTGVRVVEEGDLVAVLHETPDMAEKALALIKAEFHPPQGVPDVNNSSIFHHLEKTAPKANVVVEAGDVTEGEKQAVNIIEEKYVNQYVAHAPLEPHTALAVVDGEHVMIWASTQAPFRTRDGVAEVLGVSPKNVRVITPFVGGGFGGKTRSQQAEEAARLAKLTGKPVMVAWTRQEEFFYDTFRPAAVIRIKSGIDGSGKIVSWDYMNYFAGSRSSEPFYDIPHYRVLVTGGWQGARGSHPFGTGAWRGPGSNTNVFAMESHTDIMAEKAGMDPLTFRLNNLTEKRMRRVVEAAAQQFGKKFSKLPSGKGYGIAVTDYLNTYVATMAEVSVNKKSGEIKVLRLVCAQDTGEIINPEGIKMQIEGCLTMGLGYVLTEEIHFQGGDILDKNFDTYLLPRFSWLPRIETVLVDNPELAPQGCGEPAVTTMGAVIANAVYDAVGVRFFQLPMTPDQVKKHCKER